MSIDVTDKAINYYVADLFIKQLLNKILPYKIKYDLEPIADNNLNKDNIKIYELYDKQAKIITLLQLLEKIFNDKDNKEPLYIAIMYITQDMLKKLRDDDGLVKRAELHSNSFMEILLNFKLNIGKDEIINKYNDFLKK
jgi:hypothetical protein